MGMSALPLIAVVTRPTRLAGLKARYATTKQAEFILAGAAAHEAQRRLVKQAPQAVLMARGSAAAKAQAAVQALQADADGLVQASDYQDEDSQYATAVSQLMSELDLGYPLKVVDRGFVPNFDFGRCIAVVVIGQDGLVANTAKYVGNLPILGVNPDPARNDGVLLPFSVETARVGLQRTLKERARVREVTLAEVNTSDGQRMLAFNDFFLGASSHVSARYTLETQGRREAQSSSGMIVATGAGSTGWMSSLFNMTSGVARFLGSKTDAPPAIQWEDRRLIWMVREPFRSKHSGAEMVVGTLDQGEELVAASQMPSGGVIFSDGIESDFLEFNSGAIVRFGVSQQRARLVVNDGMNQSAPQPEASARDGSGSRDRPR